MRPLPVRLRLSLAFAAAMAVVLAALGFLLYTRMESALDNAVERNLRARGDDIAALVQHGGIGLPQGGSGLSEEGQTFAQVLDRDANIVDSTAELDQPLLSSSDVARVEGGPFFVERRVPGGDEIARLFVTPFDPGPRGSFVRGPQLFVVVGESLEAKEDALENLLTLLLIGGPLLLVLSSGGAYLLAGRALRPVNAALARERRFVADASHELRTPLAALRTELELALRRERRPEELQAALRSAAEETDRLSKLAEDLLVLARAQDGKLPVRRERLTAGEVFGTVVARHRERATAGGRSIRGESGDAVVLSADRVRLEQALGNLVDNALRYGRGDILLASDQRNGRVELHVRDEGPGFGSDFLPHAFDPFARSDPARSSEGAGLGLAIVDVIARAHGGSAHAADTADGADVWLELPTVPVESAGR